MIELSMFAFFALLEIMAGLVILVGYMYWRQRKARGANPASNNEASADDHHAPTPSLYLNSEAAKTQTFVNELKGDARAEPTNLVLRAALAVRAGLLRKESELARKLNSHRDTAHWIEVAEWVKAELNADAFIHASDRAQSVHGDDDHSVEILAAQQTRTIQHLREYIDQLLGKLGHQPSPDASVIERFDEVERTNREMTICIAVMEDENSFLRDQIAALLKLEQ